jgi:hypothetical protein
LLTATRWFRRVGSRDIFPGDEPDRAGVRVTVISAFDVGIAVLS